MVQRLSMQISRMCRVRFIPAFVFQCIMFINASCVISLGLEVEAFREARCGCSSLGCGVRVDMIGRDCELEISKILLMVDPRGWGVTVWHHCIHVHCDIALSWVWVHGMVIHL